MNVQEFLNDKGMYAKPVYNRSVVEIYKDDEKQFEILGSDLIGKSTEEVIELMKTKI